MKENIINKVASIGNIIAAILIVLTFFGIDTYSQINIPSAVWIIGGAVIFVLILLFIFTRFFKNRKVNSREFILNNYDSPILSVKAKDIRENDKDFLLVKRKLHWIKNFSTLKFILDSYSYTKSWDKRNLNKHKKYIPLREFESYKIGKELNIDENE